MTWLVFGVSCLLVLAGAVSIISGAPIIQLERGWAEVISGTVALSSGGVVFALAGILMRLESIRDVMAARTVPIVAESLPAAALARPEERIETTIPTASAPVDMLPGTAAPLARDVARHEAETETAPEPETIAAEPEGATQALWKRVKRPGDERPMVETLRQHGFPDRVLPDETKAAPQGATPPVLVPAHPVPITPPVLAVPVPAIAEAPRDVPPAEADTGQIGWLERSLFKARAARGDEAARPEPSFGARAAAAGENRVEPSLTATEPAFPPEHGRQAPGSDVAAEPEPTPDLASEFHKDASVIGRYQAGSASYVMYSDGTIEVETESGEMHRFGSMEELKGFIAQQDAAVI